MERLPNPYLDDARLFLERVSRLLDEGVPNQLVPEVVLFAAVGLERLVKAVLYQVNPVFVLEDTTFKNAAPVAYAGCLTPCCQESGQIARDPNRNVVPFRIAVLRASALSPGAATHKSALLALNDFRNTVAHGPLVELDREKALLRLQAHFVPIVTVLAAELGATYQAVAGDIKPALGDAAGRAEDALVSLVRAKLERHQEIWEAREKDSTRRLFAEKKTWDATRRHGSDTVACPACGNDAVLEIEADWEIDKEEGGGYVTGVYVGSLHCYYCDLAVDDQEEIGYLGLDEALTGASL